MHYDTSPARQAERRSAVYSKHREFCRDYFDDDGRFRFERPVPDTRSGLFHAFSFLHGDEADVRLANRLIAQAPIDREAFKSLHKFYPMLAAELLNHHGERLEAEQRDRLTNVLKAATEGRAQERRPGGYNDNHPLLEAGSILAGAAVVPTDTAVLATATGALEQTLRLLDRRGFLSEYTSPTYSPISMLCFAEIAEFCPSERARELARECEHRLWLEIASHWHPATCSLAGPHSRAYQIDLLAHLHNAHLLMYLVFGGDAVPIHPLNHLFPYYDERQVRHHCLDEFLQGATEWHLAPTYHVPDEAVELAWAKPNPTTVIATSEFGEFPRSRGTEYPDPETPFYEFPAGHTVCTTYLTDRFALGTSRREFLQGEPDTNVHLAFARNSPARSIADVATLYPALLVGRFDPDRDTRPPNRGRALTVQSEGRVMTLQRPRVSWGGKRVDDAATEIDRIQLSLFLTCFHDRTETVRIGEQTLDGLEGESTAPEPVFIRDHGVYLAIHPLMLTDHGREAAIRVRAINGYLDIGLISYEGEPRTFSDFELCNTLTGFVLAVSDEGEWPDFDAFCQAEAAAEIVDWQHRPSRRETIYRCGGRELAMEISPISEGLKYAAIDGRLAPEPRFSVNGRSVIGD